MDPVGGAASLLTLLNAAGGTCKLLYTLVHNMQEAPNDIRKQNEKLQCLYQTITQLADIYASLPSEHQTGAPWHRWAAEFAAEVASIKIKIQRKTDSLDSASIGSRFGESLRWMLFDRQLRRFYDSLEHWNIIFFQAVTVTQLALMVRVDQNAKKIASLSQQIWEAIESPAPNPFTYAEKPCIASNVGMHYGNDTNMIAVTKNPYPYKQHATIAEPTEIKTRYIAWRRTLSLKVRFGPLIVKQSSSIGRQRSCTTATGYGFASSLNLPWMSRRLSFILFGIFPLQSSPSLDMRFSLRMPRIFHRKSACYQAAQRGHTTSLRQLLHSGEAKIFDVAPQGDTLLHIASRSSQAEIISLLVGFGADVNATNDLGMTPLHLCIEKGQSYECARLLITSGADMFLQCLAGRTPLHTFYNSVMARLLETCRDDIDISIQDEKGMTIMHYACWSKLPLANLLQRPATGNTAFAPDLYESYDQALETKDAIGRSILHFATQRGNTALMQYLLCHSQSNSFAQLDYCGQSVLHYAVASRRVHAIDLALEHGISISARDDLGRSAMHHAAMRGNLAAVKHLLHVRGFEQLRYKDKKGKTPSDMARDFSSTAVIEFLAPFCHGEDLRSNNQGPSIESVKVVPLDSGRIKSHVWLHSLTLALAFMALGIVFYLH